MLPRQHVVRLTHRTGCPRASVGCASESRATRFSTQVSPLRVYPDADRSSWPGLPLKLNHAQVRRHQDVALRSRIHAQLQRAPIERQHQRRRYVRRPRGGVRPPGAGEEVSLSTMPDRCRHAGGRRRSCSRSRQRPHPARRAKESPAVRCSPLVAHNSTEPPRSKLHKSDAVLRGRHVPLPAKLGPVVGRRVQLRSPLASTSRHAADLLCASNLLCGSRNRCARGKQCRRSYRREVTPSDNVRAVAAPVIVGLHYILRKFSMICLPCAVSTLSG